ncbi:hypothetical protein JRQ81_011580, partial [Phrynocephalus forsythii]
ADHAVRAFMFLGMIAGAVSFFGLCASFFKSEVASMSLTKTSANASILAALFAMIAMAVFTGVSAGSTNSYGWSFGLGWASFPLFLITGLLMLIAMSVYTGHFTSHVSIESRGWCFWVAWFCFPCSLAAGIVLFKPNMIFLAALVFESGCCQCFKYKAMIYTFCHASHGWTTFTRNADTYNSGLWIMCTLKFGCHPMQSTDVYLDITRSFMVLGLLASVIAMVWAIDWDHVIHCNFTFVPKSLMTSIFSFLSGICVLLALLVFEIKLNKKSKYVPHSKEWAFYLTFPICGLCFLAGIYNFVTYKKQLWGTGKSATHVGPDGIDDADEDLPHIFSTGWGMFEEDTVQPIYSGLWTVCRDEKCSYLRVRETNLDFVRAFMAVATFSSLLTILSSTEWDPLTACMEDFFPEGPLAAMFSFLTGCFMLTAMLIFEVTFNELLEPVTLILAEKWSFFLTCATCGLSFATGLLNFLIYKFPSMRGRPEGHKVLPV